MFVDPVHEEVHGSHLGELVVGAVQPQHLLTVVLLRRDVLDGDRRGVVPGTQRSFHDKQWPSWLI